MTVTQEGINRLFNMLPATSRFTDPVKNVANELMTTALSSPGNVLMQGTIIRSSVGMYDAVVKCSNHLLLSCIYLTNCLGFKSGFGVSESNLLTEGTSVLVYKLSNNCGVILGAIPLHLPQAFLNNPPWSTMIGPCESGVGLNTDLPFKDTQKNACNIRPEDVVPGNYVLANEQQVSFAILNLAAVLKATERAKLELYVLDDFVRLTSGQYQHISSAWTQNVLNDYGYNTDEKTGSHHQCEMFGLSTYDKSFTEDDKYDQTTNENSCKKLIKNDLLQRNRYHTYLGHLGGLFNLFIANPDPKVDVTTYSGKQIDQGLLQTHIDGSGRLMIRSAAGICMQRTDKISIPKKLKEPWDPTGQKVETKDPTEQKKAFEWDNTYPYARHLQLADAVAWYTKTSYQRFIELNEDWYLPNVTELKVPDEDYDKIGNKVYGNEKFKENEDRKSMVSLEQDGSIIIRDAWGSEIVMKGGNITISCPGNLELRPGKSVIALGGHDVVIKGRKSVDVVATENDVRIKAEKNLQLYSSDGGILVESNSPERGQAYKDAEGEQVISSGIVLKAKKSRIFMWADTIHLGFVTSLLLEAYKSSVGAIYLLANSINGFATQQINMVTSMAGMLLNKVDGILFGNGAYVFGNTNAGMFKSTKFYAPFQMTDVDMNPYSQVQNQTSEFYDKIWSDGESDDILGNYTIEYREDIMFKFRNDEQYGTLSSTEVYEGGTKFLIYETSWSCLKQNGSKFIEGTIEKWTEKDVNNTWPWPGKDAYKNPCLVYLTNEVNNADNKLKPYREIVNKSGMLDIKSMNELSVIKV